MLVPETMMGTLCSMFFLGGLAAAFVEIFVVDGIDSLKSRKSLLFSRTICLSVLASVGSALVVFATNAWSDLDAKQLVTFPVAVGISLSPVLFIGLVFFVLVYEHLLDPIVRWIKRARRDAIERQAKMEADRRAELQAIENRKANAERARAESIENQRRAVERAKLENVAASAQKLREDARARCEVYFGLHGPEIGNRFSRSMFDDFVTRYMDDNRSPEEVRERAAQLLGILEQHLHRVEPPREKSLEAIVSAFEARKQKVRVAALDTQDQELLLMQLDAQREEAIRRAMAEGTL